MLRHKTSHSTTTLVCGRTADLHHASHPAPVLDTTGCPASERHGSTMAQGDTPITVVGNLVADPDLRYTPTGTAVVNFRVASTPRRFDTQTNQYVDGDALFLTCNLWRQAAENVANSLNKGDRVIVTGRLRQRSYETREGDKRTVFELEADDVAPSVKYATARVVKTPRDGGGTGGQGGFAGRNAGESAPSRSSSPSPSRSASQLAGGDNRDPWASAPHGDDDEPPPF